MLREFRVKTFCDKDIQLFILSDISNTDIFKMVSILLNNCGHQHW